MSRRNECPTRPHLDGLSNWLILHTGPVAPASLSSSYPLAIRFQLTK